MVVNMQQDQGRSPSTRTLRGAARVSSIPSRWLISSTLLVLAGCFFDELSGPKARCSSSSFTINPDSTVIVGGTRQFTASVITCSAGPTHVIWSSRDASVVFVDSTGLAHGLKIDTVTIRARLTAPELDTGLVASRVIRVLAYGAPSRLIAVSGSNGQGAVVGTAVKMPPAVIVQDDFGNVVPDAPVVFRVDTTISGWVRDSFGGQLKGVDTVRSNANGVATVGGWVLSTNPGPNTLTATTDTVSLSPPFSAIGSPPPQQMDSIRLGNTLLVSFPQKLAADSRNSRVYVTGSDGVAVIDVNADTAMLMVNVGATLVAADSLAGWVYGASGNTLTAYDGATLTPKAVTALPGVIKGLASVPEFSQVWAVGNLPDSVYVLDAKTLQVQRSVVVPASTGLAVNVSTKRAYLVSAGGLTVLDASVGVDTLIATFPRGLSPGPIAVNSATNRIFASSGSGLEVFDGATDSWLTPVPLLASLATESVFDISVHDGTNHVYATVERSDPQGADREPLLAIVDATTNAVTRIPMEGVQGVVVNRSTDRAYVAAGSAVFVIDGATNAIRETVVRAGPPIGVAVDAARKRVYVVDSVTNSMSTIDGLSNVEIGLPMLLSGNAWGVAVDSGLDRVFVTHSDTTGSVEVIDGQTSRVLGFVSVGRVPRGIAVNQASHEVYVANEGDGTISVIDGQGLALIGAPIQVGSAYMLAVGSDRFLYVVGPPMTNGGAIVDLTTRTLIANASCGCAGGVATISGRVLAYSPLGNDDNQRQIGVIDSAGRVLNVATSGYAEAIGADSATNVVYVPTDAGIDLISADINRPVGRVLRQMHTRGPGVAINPRTGRIYLADPTSNKIFVIHD